MGDTLRSILTRLVAYLGVVIAAGLLFLAGATVYELMWPRPASVAPSVGRDHGMGRATSACYGDIIHLVSPSTPFFNPSVGNLTDKWNLALPTMLAKEGRS